MYVSGDSITRKIYQYMAKNWIVASSIVAIPFVIDYVCLFKMNDDNKRAISIFIGILMFIAILFTVVRNMAIKYDERKRTLTSEYYNGLVNVMTLNTVERMETILEIFDSEEYKDKFKSACKTEHNPFDNPSSRLNPYKHIKEYCHNAQIVIRDSFGASQDDIVISILYRNTIDENVDDKKWRVLYSTYNVMDITPNSIVSNSNSSFNQVKDKPGKIFFKSKCNAYNEFHYMQTEQEELTGLLGTIYCHNISIMRGERILLPLVINIASFNAPLCEENDEFAIIKAKKLFDIIEENIRYEVIKMILHKQMGLREFLDRNT